jgi:16S rRNA (adenine1518-N6/adenine1519-N6)-dimethyltransferase
MIGLMPRPRKRFGQHFLEDAWVRKVIDIAAPVPDDRFLEIGPGRGALTLALAPRVGRLVAVEIDRDLAAGLTEEAQRRNVPVTILAGDFLDLDLRVVIERDLGAPPVRAIGNLPYNVSSPILFKLTECAELFTDATLMLQREVADRLLARPGSGDYGVLSILAGVHADVTRLLDLPPGAFRPPPKVRSTVVRLRFHPPSVPRDELPSSSDSSVGVPAPPEDGGKRPPESVSGARPRPPREILTRSGVDGTRRPEMLEMTELSRLAQLINA